MVCLENAKYRGTLGRNEGGWGMGFGVFKLFLWRKSKSTWVLFAGGWVGGWVPALKIHFFQKIPSKRG